MLVNGAARAEAPDAMQDDVAATLDAAFALIDACLPSPRSLSGNERFSALPTANFGSERPRAPWSSEGKGSHEVLSIAQGERAADATRATGRGRKQMAHRSRQKEEIARLRGEAALLEAQLDAMRALSSLESSRIPRARESPGLEVLVELKRVEFPIGAVSLLKGIAARQKKLRAASEAENARLRSVMSAQRSAIRSIKRLLIRETERQISPQQQFNPGHQLVGMDNMVMEHLYEELDEIYGGVDPIFQRYGMPNASMVPTQQRVTRLSATKYVALVMESRIMPFSYQQTASAMWELTLDNCNRCVPNSDLKGATVVGDTVFRSYAVDSLKNAKDFASRGDHALRKFGEEARIVFVTNGRGQPRGIRGAEIGDVVYHEVGRIVVAPVPRQQESSTPLCCLRMCMELTADIDEESKGKSSRALAFLRLLMANKTDAHEEFSEALETKLLRH